MHGRIKIGTTKEQEEARLKRTQEKVRQYQLAMGAIHKMRNKGLKDEEALKIIEQLLSKIPDISTLWNYRREILLFLRESEDEEKTQERSEYELKLTEVCLRVNPKSYGAWHQRCWILENSPKPDWSAEVALCDKYLDMDERNFHGWDYRRFVIAHAQVSRKDEIHFTTRKIQTNFSNYSSWHYRSRLLSYSAPLAGTAEQPTERPPISEFELVNNAVFTDPGDQSAWIYLRWLLGKVDTLTTIERASLTKDFGLLAFSQAISLTADVADFPADYRLQVFSESEENIPVKCEPVWSCKYSNLWIFGFHDPGTLERNDALKVKVTSAATNKEIQPAISFSTKNGSTNFSSRSPQFSAPLKGERNEAVKNVYSSCKELIALEPDSKWAHLTCLLTMRILNKHDMLDDILSEIKQLCEIDPKRVNYYKDLRSRIVMECALERQSEISLEINLSNENLTSIYHSQYLCLLQRVDLSKNKLARSLPALAALQSCEDLKLDENELKDLNGFPTMPALRVLSLKNNALTDVDALTKNVASCKLLKSIDAFGNPCMLNFDGKINLL